MSPKTRILGIDPGISVTGYGLIDYQAQQAKLVECGVIKSKTNHSSAERYQQMYAGIKEVIKNHKPECLAVEDSFLGKNFKSAKILGGAKAVILLAGAESKLKTCEYSPREIKMAVVGRGEASKEQVNYMVSSILKLKSAPHPEDASDALAVALCCAFRSNLSRGR
ncbi:MAG: crossover junction endodeoxyribonuclease RuvC [candidate division Zixibacteria bacterium RBG_16_48_11]|nr:MAG: crossover junction endodeoxyribonuclease RuvC [candidate division Zixibacteria bacterium RBG_16_48_11]